MAIKLRDYQQDSLDKTIAAIRKGCRHPLIVLPTGAGKTALSSEFVRRSYEKGKSSIFICHRQELLMQTYKTYQKNDITPAIIKSGVTPDYRNPMQIASVSTLVKRLNQYAKPDVVFWDECSHIASSTWKTIYEAYPDSIHIGLTATPCRLDGKPLNSFFDCMIQTVDTAKLIKLGYLTPYNYYAPSNIDTSEIAISSNGDFQKESLANASFNSKIIGDNVEQYLKLANGKRNIVFAINRLHGQQILERYLNAGVSAEYLDGLTGSSERKTGVERFSSGETKVLINCDLFSEGFDVPACEVVSLLRPTMSTSLYLQQVGRALRISPETGKTMALVLDHVNNYQRHGMPDDEREWSLSGGLTKKRKTEQSTESIMRCPKCFFAHSKALSCPNCGYTYTTKEKQIQEVAGELVLIGSQEYKNARQRETLNVSSLDELVKIEKDRGYKFGFAERQWQLKTGENLWSNVSGLEKIAKARGYSDSWVWVQKNKVRNKR